MKIKQFNTIAKGDVKIHALKNKYPEYEAILDIKQSLEGIRDVNADVVSRAISDMSNLLCRIGELVAELTVLANEHYSYRKYKNIWEFNALGNSMSIKMREKHADDAVFDEVQDELVARYVADYFKAFKDDISRYIMVLQTRIKVLSQERIEANNS